MNKLGMLVLTLALAAPASGQQVRAVSQATGGGAGPSLFPGDAVRVQIYEEPDLSGTFRVDEKGTLTLPLLGPQSVAGLGTDEFKRRLLADYRYHLKNASIEVTVLRRVSVIGEVQRPGLYDVEATMRIGDVLALAGGVTPDGKEDDFKILRDGAEIAEDLEVTAPIGDLVRSGDQVLVDERGWFSRNTAVVLGVGATITGLVLRGVLD